MPGPALPAWVFWVVGAAAAGLIVLITYFVTSSQAKARAAEFKEKVLRIVEALKRRLDLLEEALRDARRAREEAEARAQEAECAARDADAAREAAAKRAHEERERALRAAQAAVDLERQLAEARAELEKWRGEAEVAERLGAIAGATLSRAVVLEVRAISAASVVLGGRLPRPERAMSMLDTRIAQVEATNVGLEQVLRELAVSLAVADDEEAE